MALKRLSAAQIGMVVPHELAKMFGTSPPDLVYILTFVQIEMVLSSKLKRLDAALIGMVIPHELAKMFGTSVPYLV